MTAPAADIPVPADLARQLGCSYVTAYHRVCKVRAGVRTREYLYMPVKEWHGARTPGQRMPAPKPGSRPAKTQPDQPPLVRYRCPVTSGCPTRMSAEAFAAACAGRSKPPEWPMGKRFFAPPPRCQHCGGKRANWPAELAVTKGEPMTTKTTTKPAAKPAAKKDHYADQVEAIALMLAEEAVTHDATLADQVQEIISALHDATDKLTATISVLSHFGEGRDPVRLAQNAVSCCRDLEEQVKAERPADPVARVITSTILSGRGEIHVVIRPYTPASTPTETQP